MLEEVQTVTLYTARDLAINKEITNRPNPFNPNEGETTIMFRPTASGIVTVTMYDL